jgi:hypothetical protein
MLLRSLPLLIAAGALTAWPAIRASAIGEVKPKSLSKLTFSPDGRILFAADSIGARIYALEIEGEQPVPVDPTAKTLDIPNIEEKIAPMIGADTRDVLIHDMSVNPVSRNTYLTVSRGRRGFSKPFQLPNEVANATVLLRVTGTGKIEEVRLDRIKHAWVDIANPIPEGKPAASWKKAPESERADVVSDMHFIDGKLYVAGLSNEEFASTLRIYSYPFQENAPATQLEIYHGAHGQWETESPIRSFLPYSINGKPHLVAAYLCTPVATFPLEALKDKAKVRGTTISELGAGNFPVDMVAFRSQGKSQIMVVNNARGLMAIDEAELSKPHEPIVAKAEAAAGAKFQQVRGQGVLMAENYGPKHLLVLQRDVTTGVLSLKTWALERE